jgi:hypothetical protein
MRPIERIDNFLSKVNWPDLAIKWNITNTIYEDFFDEKFDNAIKYWKENTDMRIGQVLINLGLIKDDIKIWEDEEEDILLNQGIAPEECIYWKSYYDKNMNRIPEINRLIKDLDTIHIYNIYIHFFNLNCSLTNKYRKAFRNVLISRNESTSILDFIELLWDLEKIKYHKILIGE